MKRLVPLFLILLCICGLSVAQNSKRIPNKPILMPRPMPQINVQNLSSTEKPVRISDVKVDVRIVGTMAVTTVDMTFHNPNNRVLEGELQFPLGDGQSISRFALDINGKLREGVVVDKAKGQEAFESVIRQRIDPGLLEKTQGNNFRTRVYPLPGRGTRRIVIAYEQELLKEKDGFRFHLPVEYGNILDQFSLNLTVFAAQDKPQVDETPWGNFVFDRSGDAYVASYKASNYNAKGQLVFRVPDNNSQRLFVEKGMISNDHYFYANVEPEMKKESNTKSKPTSIALYWDASSSMENRNFDREFDFLDQYIKELGNVRVHLYTFNCDVNKVASIDIKDGNTSNLKEHLENVKYDGATEYGILKLASINNTESANSTDKVMRRVKRANESDEIFLFSDGLANFGETEPILGNTPVNTITSILSSDHANLKYISSATGGRYINLAQQSAKEAITNMKSSKMQFIRADYNKSEVSELTPSMPQAIDASTVFSVTGRLKTETANITLHFGIDNQILYSKTITIRKSDAKDYDNIVERTWAEKKIAELDIRYQKNKTEIEAMGKRFNIVTRNTSLIVLDRVEDYVRYEITPPEELLTQYNSQISYINKNRNDAERNNIESVVRMLDARKVWWNKSYPKTCPNIDVVSPKKNGRESVANAIEIHELSDADMMTDIQPIYARDMNMTIEDEIAPFAMMQESKMMMDMSSSENMSATRRWKMESSASAKKDSKGSSSASQPIQQAKIELKGWSPDTPYMTILKGKSDKELYRIYLDIKDGYKTTPSFYLDVASLFEERGMKKEAFIILSNLAELEVENYRLLRVLGHRLNQLGYREHAIKIFDKVLELRPNEPQSLRDLGLVYTANGDYQKAIDALYQIANKTWDGRFPEIEVIAIEEMNKAITEAKAKNVKLDLSSIDDRLIYDMPVNIRIVLNWDTDNSDMDLWVTDPCGEKCYYSNARTRVGGLISRDFTQGYGPEEFMIKNAIPGKYKIQANYYGTREQTLVGPTTIYLDIYTYYSSKKEKKETITMRLSSNKEVIDIGEIIFDGK